MARIIETDDAPEAVGPYSQATVANGLVFTAGQIAMTSNGGDLTEQSPDGQAEQCLRNLERVLDAAGAGLADIVKTTVYLTDIEDYDAVNEVYSQFFQGEPPARSAVGVAELPREADVEIEAIATAE